MILKPIEELNNITGFIIEQDHLEISIAPSSDGIYRTLMFPFPIKEENLENFLKIFDMDQYDDELPLKKFVLYTSRYRFEFWYYEKSKLCHISLVDDIHLIIKNMRIDKEFSKKMNRREFSHFMATLFSFHDKIRITK